MPVLNRRAFFTTCTAGGTAVVVSSTASTQPVATPAPTAGAPSPTPEQRLRTILNGAAMTQLAYVATRYGIADQLVSGPKSVDQLATVAGVHTDALYRCLRCLAGHGVFIEEAGRQFRQNEASALLAQDTPRSLRAQFLVRGEDFFWRAFGSLRDSVKTGKTGFDLAYGQNTFEWFKSHPEAARVFDAGQAELTRSLALGISKSYPFGRARQICDIGGGNGALLAQILADHPGPIGTLFDLPHVVDAADPALTARFGSRLRRQGGDFFAAVPEGHDLYLMKYILHDWEDAKALAILARTKAAMGQGTTLLVLEDLVCGPNVPCNAKIGDITMLARTGGRNMTEAEYRDLLTRGGFAVQRVIPAVGDHHVIECTPTRS